MGSRNWRKVALIAVIFVAWVVAYADRIVMSTAVIPIAQEFRLNDQERGYVLGAFYFTYAFMQLGGGWLADRHGAKRVLTACIVMWSVFTALTGMSWSFTSLLVIRLLFGIGEGGFAPANAVAIAENFEKRERGRVQSLMSSTVFLGNAAGSIFVATVIAAYGWRWTFPALGVCGVMVAAAFVFMLEPRKRMHVERDSSGTQKRAQCMQLLRNPLTWRVGLIWFCSSTLFLGLQSWMPSYLLKLRGIDIQHIGVASMIPYIVAFFGTNAVGHVIDKAGAQRSRPLMACGALLCALFLTLMMTTSSLPLLVLYWTLCIGAFTMVYATVFTVPLKYFPNEHVGSATGLINFGGQMAGFIAPVIMGHLIGAFNGSYVGAFLYLVLSAAIASAIACTLKTPRANEERAPAALANP
ncbi:MFS transporter [Paraburkholderia strydomiana]|uniref:MFS transporter n=1 Tax=Paraburkholderia strydomiana TaxID=1245417 RepID=UPI0038BB4D58